MNIICIDAQNIYKATQQQGRIVDFKLLYIYLLDKYSPDSICYFVGYIASNHKLYSFLESIGYKLITKKSGRLPDGTIKGNVDIDIAIYTVDKESINHIEHIILMTGDGDFNSLVEYHQQKGSRVTIIAPNEQYCSKFLKEVSKGDLYYLEDIRHHIQKSPTLTDRTLGE